MSKNYIPSAAVETVKVVARRSLAAAYENGSVVWVDGMPVWIDSLTADEQDEIAHRGGRW